MAKYSTTEEQLQSSYLVFSRIESDKQILPPSPFASILRHHQSFHIFPQRHCWMSLISFQFQLQRYHKGRPEHREHFGKENQSPASDRGLVLPDLPERVSTSSRLSRHHLLIKTLASARRTGGRMTGAIASHGTTQQQQHFRAFAKKPLLPPCLIFCFCWSGIP